MGKCSDGWRGLARAASGAALAGLMASCSYGPSQPAPVYYRADGAPPGWAGPAGSPPSMAMAPPIRSAPLPPVSSAPPPRMAGSSPTEITVQRGDQLGYLAERYHVSQRAIIEANRLQPPYELAAGARLIIPGSGPSPEGGPRQGPAAMAAGGPQVIPLDAGRPQPLTPPPAGRPGDSPVGTLTPPGATAPSVAGPPAVALRPPGGEPTAAEEAQAEGSPAPRPPGSASGTRGGRFPWPVQGRVVAGFGPGPGGARNDGINIAAPRGTPIHAIEGGEVAYAGNELRGYGNLVLVKHDDGWISAYAHCEELLVRKGEHVRSGQVIARVGATGSVHEPQLHFELRRGKRPVDPREFLAPAPTAGTAGQAAG